MPDHLGIRQCWNQFHRRRFQALKRIAGRCLVEAFMFQRAANQNVSIPARNRITPLGQHHARQEVRRALVKNHLPFHGFNRQRKAQAFEQITAPGTRRQHHLITVDRARRSLHADDFFAFANEPADFALLMNRHVRHRQQGSLEGFHQPRIAHVSHVGHVDRAGETATQDRHRIVRRRDIHSPQRTVFPLGPGQCLGFIVQVQPVQAGGVHFWINPGRGKQALAQLWIKVLRPMGERGDCRAVAPWVERRNDAATGPGRFLTDIRTVQQHNALYLRREIERCQQANHTAADYHHLLLHGHVPIQPLKRQEAQKAPEKKISDPSNLWWSVRPSH